MRYDWYHGQTVKSLQKYLKFLLLGKPQDYKTCTRQSKFKKLGFNLPANGTWS